MKNIFNILLVTLVLTAGSFPQVSYPVKFEEQDSTINIEESCILKIGNGDLLLFWFQYFFEDYPYDGKIFYSRSTDNGLAWSDNILLTEDIYYDPVKYGNEIDVITDDNERIYAVYKSGPHRYKYSDDSGVSWSGELFLPTYSITSRYSVSEAKLNLLNGGRLSLTYNYLKIGIYAIYSDDGLLWTSRQIIDSEGKGGRNCTIK